MKILVIFPIAGILVFVGLSKLMVDVIYKSLTYRPDWGFAFLGLGMLLICTGIVVGLLFFSYGMLKGWFST